MKWRESVPLAPRSGERVGVRGLGACAAAAGLLLSTGLTRAEERPDEEAMFGGGDTTTTTTTSTSTTATTTTSTSTSTATTADSRDALNLSDPKAATRFSGELAPEDPLKIGGQLYWRLMTMAGQGQDPQDWGLRTPALLDVYLDARPNERVRAFVLGRMSYDPTQPASGSAGSTFGGGGSAQSSDSTSVGGLGQTGSRGPNVLLDQLWLRFDVRRRVFVTAGKQHVRWGTARFWTPTDYLHVQPRNPLLPFDARAGVPMLKLHVPWEARGWNFYAYALPENVDGTSTMPLRKVAAAARAEVVFGAFEAGAGVFGRENNWAKFAGDVSFGVWDLDFYSEIAVRNAGDIDFVHYQGASDPCPDSTGASLADLARYYTVARGSGWKPQATGGVSYTRKYADKDLLLVGAEYFYNGLGYSSVQDYPGLIALSQTMTNPASFFYLGRQYLGLFISAPAPYSWDLHTFSLSTLANLTDQSGITRFDYAYTLLTHIRFEAYAAVHWGQRNGEFRLGFDSASLPCPPPDRKVWPPSLFDIGLGLRVAM
jgi:hypothetical protein